MTVFAIAALALVWLALIWVVALIIGALIAHGHDHEPDCEASPYAYTGDHDEYDWAAGESELRAPYDWKKTGL